MSSRNDFICLEIIPIENLNDGEKYRILVGLPMSIGWIENMNFIVKKGNQELRFFMNHKKNDNGKAFFETDVTLETRGIYHYYFSYEVNNQTKYVKRGNTFDDNFITRDEMWKMSVNFKTPDWAKGKIMYHIFVDRYRRGSKDSMQEMPRRIIHKSWDEDMLIGPDYQGIWNNDFYGGDLKGIEESLDYIKSLGVTIIYLSPIVWSQSNHRYDTSDYETVDPYVGCNEDLVRLCNAAHKKGMRVILDAVFNHTGNDSKYFNEYGTFDTVGAYKNMDSPYAPFYKKYFEDGQLRYHYWWGMLNLPVCDGYSKEWQNYIVGEGGIIDKWFLLGIDGLRLDVADELTDEFIEKIRMAVKRNKRDGLILGEVWKNPMHMGRGYIESGKGMDSVMNYSLVDALIRYFKYGEVNQLSSIINDIKNEYPSDSIYTLMNFTSTHDISRAINIFALNDFKRCGEWVWDPNISDLELLKKFKLTKEQYKQGREIYEAYIFALAFMPGILSIFYGDEVGLEGLGNLLNRKPYPWGHRDKKLLEYFRYVGKIRQEQPFLERAELNILDINKNYMLFERLNGEEQALIAVNRTNEESRFLLPSGYEKKDKVYTLKKSRIGYLSPYGGVAIKKKIC